MKSPMQAFVGVDFDCESSLTPLHRKIISPLVAINKCADKKTLMHFPQYGGEYLHCRPRLNKAQLLVDYAPILVDGLLWDANYRTADKIPSEILKTFSKGGIHWIAFKGVEKGSEYEEWARDNDVPIYNKDMERVA